MMIDGFGNILEPCHHQKCSLGTAIAYCSLLAVAYVGCLYVFVPPKIRKLSRDHPTHIKYRSQACLIVCALAILSYPSVFCVEYNDNDTTISSSSRPLFSVSRTMILPPLGSFLEIFGVLLHTCILYTGPVVASLLYMHELSKRSARPLSDIVKMRWRDLKPNSEQQFWITMRNYILAPWTEEVIFRGCMVQSLLATGMAPTRVALVAPLFFGVAHLHHAIQKLSDGEPPKRVILVTVVQLLYTSLFGSYVSHAFLRVGSVLSVTLSHSYCNWMGLPDLACFANSHHPLHPYKRVLFVSYMIGISAFWYLFRVDLLLPLPSKLPILLNQNA